MRKSYSEKWPLSRRLRHIGETAAAYLIYGFFGLLPLATASATGGWMMSRLGPRLDISRTAARNIARAFPEKSKAEKEDILSGMWENLGRVIAEYPHLRRIWPHVDLAGAEHIAAARDSGKPAIFFAGHIANWEILAIGAKKAGLPLHLVYRKPNNPWVDGLLRHARNSGAAGHIGKNEDGARAILSILKKNGAVGLLVDQKLTRGVPAAFFGRDAMTAPAIAHFALKFNCPLYPARVERLKGAGFRMTVFPPLAIVPTGDQEEDVKRILTDINALLESWIRDRPAQWLWTHRRWPEE